MNNYKSAFLSFNLDESGKRCYDFTIENFKYLLFNELFRFCNFNFGVSYYLYIMDAGSRVHGSYITFELKNDDNKEKNRLASSLYKKIYKTIYNSDGSQKKSLM